MKTIWILSVVILFLIVTLLVILIGCSLSQKRKQSKRCKSPTFRSGQASSPISLVLWHEGYYNPALGGCKDPETLKLYLNSLLCFVTQKPSPWKSVMITIPLNSPPKSACMELIRCFVKELVENNIIPAFYLTNKTDPYSQINYIVSELDLETYYIGVDTEGWSLKSVDIPGFLIDLRNQLNPTKILVAGASPYDSKTWGNAVAVIENYSTGTLNDIFSSNINNPGALINALKQAGEKLQTADNNTWPAFAISDNHPEIPCIGQIGARNLQKKNACGAFRIMGQWSLDSIIDLLGQITPASVDNPTYVIYQGDFLPQSWLPSKCTSLC